MDRLIIEDARVRSVGYLSRKQELEITFVDGETRLYMGVAPGVYLNMMQSDNVGDYFTQHLEYKFVFQKLK